MQNRTKNKQLDYLDIYDVVSILLSKKVTIFIITSAFAIISIAAALNIDNQYRSSATLYENISYNNRYSGGDILPTQLFGMNKSPTLNNINLSKEILFSRSFAKKILNQEDLLINIFAVKTFDPKSGQVIFNDEIYDFKNKSWINNSKVKPPTLLDTQNAIMNLVTYNHDSDSGFVKIDVTHKSPNFAKELLEFIILEINESARIKAINDSNKSLYFLKASLKETTQSILIDSLSSLITSQLEKQMIANVETEYLLIVLDEPYFPEKKVLPNRAFIVIISTLIGILISVVYILGFHFYNMKQNQIANNY